MKHVVILGMSFRLCSIEEAEKTVCRRFLVKTPIWRIPILPRIDPTPTSPTPVFFPKMARIVEVVMAQKPFNPINYLKEFLNALNGIETYLIDSTVFSEIDGLFLDQDHPKSSYSKSDEPLPLHARLSSKTMEAIDNALGRIYERGVVIDDEVTLFIHKNQIFIIAGQPIYYGQNQEKESEEMAFGYAMVRQEACIRLLKK
jgi:hypothetical protein